MQKKILVIGASGYLGNNIYNRLKQSCNHQVLGTYNTEKKCDMIKCDVLKTDDIDQIIKMNFDVIIWAMSNQDNETKISNIGLKHLISRVSNALRFIYISTTVGQGKDQSERIKPHIRGPHEYLHEYINGKIIGESIVKEHPNHVIIRPGSIYGFGYNHEMDNRMMILYRKFQSGLTYNRTANLYASFVNVNDLTNAIIELITLLFRGIINVAQTNPLSHYEFNKCLAKMMNLDDYLLIPDYRSYEGYHTLSSELRMKCLKTEIKDINHYVSHSYS